MKKSVIFFVLAGAYDYLRVADIAGSSSDGTVVLREHALSPDVRLVLDRLQAATAAELRAVRIGTLRMICGNNKQIVTEILILAGFRPDNPYSSFCASFAPAAKEAADALLNGTFRDCTFGEFVWKRPDPAARHPLNSVFISVRARRGLGTLGAKNLEDVLNIRIDDFLRVRGMGRTTLAELIALTDRLERWPAIQMEMDACLSVLGEDCAVYRDRPAAAAQAARALLRFAQAYDQVSCVDAMIDAVPADVREAPAEQYLKLWPYAHPLDKEVWAAHLASVPDHCSVEEYLRAVLAPDQKTGLPHEEAVLIQRWLTSDCTAALNQMRETLRGALTPRSAQYIDVISDRIRHGDTLAETGRTLGVTRERVRQHEERIRKAFDQLLGDEPSALLALMAARAEGRCWIACSDVDAAADGAFSAFAGLVMISETAQARYSPETRIFYFSGGQFGSADVRRYAQELPDILDDEAYETAVQDGAAQFDLPDPLVAHILGKEYEHQGTMFTRRGLSRKCRYLHIIRHVFPDGFCCSSDADIEKFSAVYTEWFGGGVCSAAALTTKIRSYCVLSGRSLYRHPDLITISDSLYDEILAYIRSSTDSVLLYQNIFNEFREALAAEGILSVDALHGLLRSRGCGCALARNAILLDDSTTLYRELDEAFRATDPVSREDIARQFPGIPRYTIEQAAAAAGLLTIGEGMYRRLECLNIPDTYEPQVSAVLDRICADGPVAIAEAEDALRKEAPEFVAAAGRAGVSRLTSLLRLYCTNTTVQVGRTVISTHNPMSLKHVVIRRLGYPDVIRLRDLRQAADELDISWFATKKKADLLMPEYVYADNGTYIRARNIS